MTRKINLLREFEDEKDGDSYKITFDVSSDKIKVSFVSLTKYSQIVQDQLKNDNIFKELSEKLNEYQKANHIKTESIIHFFKILEDNEISINNDEFLDLSKLATIFKVKPLDRYLKKYLNDQFTDIDFILTLIIEEEKNKNDEETNIINNDLLIEMESCLIKNINDCFQNPKFEQINHSILYRLFESSEEINSSLLYKFICKSIEERFIFFRFVKIEELSEEQFNEICDNFEKNEYHKYYVYLPNNLKYIKNMKDEMNALKNRISKIESMFQEERNQNIQQEQLLKETSQELNKKIDEQGKIKKEKEELQQVIDENKILISKQNEMLNNYQEIETKVIAQQEENARLQKKLSDKEELMNELLKMVQLKATVTARVESYDTIKCCINIVKRGGRLDKERSKYIINQNSSQKLGENEYRDGTKITKLNNEFSINMPAGTYFLHAIIIDNYGQTEEFVSNSLTIKPKPKQMNFDFTGQVQEITLNKGIYKLEVWGASGGENNEEYNGETYSINPGKGGYSVGILKLSKTTTLYVYVGGSPRNHLGGWNGGGSAKSPAAGGGGATDISLYCSPNKTEWNSESHLYSRIIVAGGGGGASLDNSSGRKSGCGGGENGGGNEYAEGGTQNSGYDFGCGKPNTGMPSSGGGGGWHGGGACGGFFRGFGGGGGGGSGFVYNSSTASNYPNGCKLDSAFYLTDSKTIAGNTQIPSPSGSGTEDGHSGNGYAKITPQ